MQAGLVCAGNLQLAAGFSRVLCLSPRLCSLLLVVVVVVVAKRERERERERERLV
jgi:hypothetical protein